jgi:anti-sigma B factor antagonist
VSALDVHVSSSRIGGGAYAVAVTGELDLYAAEKLQLRLAQLLEDGARTVLVDLLGVSFMDSTGLAVLLSAAQALHSSAGQFVVAVDNPHVLRVIDLADTHAHLHVERTLVEAIQYVVDQRLTV